MNEERDDESFIRYESFKNWNMRVLTLFLTYESFKNSNMKTLAETCLRVSADYLIGANYVQSFESRSTKLTYNKLLESS
jgi:hypothetical protein